MRTMLACCVALVICFSVSADDEKLDAKKLIGKWEPKDKKEGHTVVIEFRKDGKATFTHTADGKEMKSEGTYKVAGNKITVTMKMDGEEKTHTHNVSKLTDTELVGTDEKGQEHKFVRIKDK